MSRASRAAYFTPEGAYTTRAGPGASATLHPAGRIGERVMIPLSILDLVPVTEGSDARQAFTRMLELARLGERLGYRRYWLAEHHNMPGIASAATAVLIGHVAGGTATIRVGAGGIMLPNHAPLQVAEQFGTLASLYPGRIDLGLGRAPGTDQAAARALAALLPGGRGVPGRRPRAAAVLRAGTARPARARRARCGRRGGGLAARLQPVRRSSRGAAGIAVRVRFALRARLCSSRRWRYTASGSFPRRDSCGRA